MRSTGYRTFKRPRFSEVAMPSERFAAALNEQVGREFAAAHQYVSIGTHYEDQTFPQLARFFYDQAEEERGVWSCEWFLEEQVEEESTMQALLAVAERTREIPMLLEEYVAREHRD